ncbi:MAG: DUF3108 domain-containing protein [Bacteroidales bacterium]
MYRNLLLLWVLIPFGSAWSQCQGPLVPFYDGETIRMEVYYHWGPLWLRAARVELKTRERSQEGVRTWEFLATGHTLPSYDWFFKVRDTFKASVRQKDFRPLTALRKTSEGGAETFNLYQFDPQRGQIFISSQNHKRPFKKEKHTFKGCLFDLLSGAYFARTFDYSHQAPGLKIPLNVAVDDKIYEVYFEFEGYEKTSLRDGTTRRLYRFSAPTLEGTVFRGNERIVVWVTDDGRNLPLKVEAKILVGSVQAFWVP